MGAWTCVGGGNPTHVILYFSIGGLGKNQSARVFSDSGDGYPPEVKLSPFFHNKQALKRVFENGLVVFTVPVEREVKSPQEKTKKVPQKKMKLTRRLTDRSSVCGVVGNDSCGWKRLSGNGFCCLERDFVR